MHILKWIGKSVNLSCNTETYPFKDNEASRLKAYEAKVNKAKVKQEKKREEQEAMRSRALPRQTGKRSGTQKKAGTRANIVWEIRNSREAYSGQQKRDKHALTTGA